jgi:hypothetical protein
MEIGNPMRRFTLSLALLLAAASTASAETVLVASRRAGWIEFIDPQTLQTINGFEVGRLAESVAASADGRTLFIAKAMQSEPEGCCGLYALDLEKGGLSFLIEPSQRVTLSPKADRLFTQRGNSGIEAFELKSLAPLPAIKAPGVYALHPSPDGRWLFGITEWDGPSLDIFDIQANQLTARVVIWFDSPSGVWLDDRFYLYAFDGRFGHLWVATPETANFNVGRIIRFPQAVTSENAATHTLIGASGRLFLYEQFGTKLDHGKPSPGGVLEIDPATGAVKNYINPELHFGRLLVSPRGDKLYGIDLPGRNWRTPTLVRLDSKTGKIEAKQELDPDVWNVALADIPAELLTRHPGVPALPPTP